MSTFDNSSADDIELDRSSPLNTANTGEPDETGLSDTVAISSSSSLTNTGTITGSPPGMGVLSGPPATQTTGMMGLSMMQSSPPPHSYRHSRAYRHFKNPPQPHMCIRTTTEAGEELFINVLSWTRIVIPQEPSDPIPLYGGMRVPPGSPRSPPIVFAVMANPEVLKDSGRHSKDPEERRAMVELMCDFVEAMNPGVKLVRNAVILKDRDISGELKDVWNAVQAQRDREREEQMIQQRQQQHYHNVTTQQMFPKSASEALQHSPTNMANDGIQASHEKDTSENESNLSMLAKIASEQQVEKLEPHQGTGDNKANHTTNNSEKLIRTDVISNGKSDDALQQSSQKNQTNEADHMDACKKAPEKDEYSNSGVVEASPNTKANTVVIASQNATDNRPIQLHTAANNKNTTFTNSRNSPTSPTKTDACSGVLTSISTSNSSHTTTISKNNITATTTTTGGGATAVTVTTTAATTVTAAVAPPTKKEKLGGFLPNGCIFPRFKNNKNKEKEKETKSKDKEKTLLNALKKNKDKKVAPIEHSEKTPTNADAKSQYEKNCINLEQEVQKLDLNKIDTNSSNDNMFIKLKMAATSASAK